MEVRLIDEVRVRQENQFQYRISAAIRYRNQSLAVTFLSSHWFDKEGNLMTIVDKGTLTYLSNVKRQSAYRDRQIQYFFNDYKINRDEVRID